MRIERATREDASLIADAILEAIGKELTDHLAGERHTRREVHDLFMRLAGREDTQYSYLNSRIARSDEGRAMGICVSYDGADLKRLRRPFFAEAIANLGWEPMTPEEIDACPEETTPDEFYLDTLMTLPEYRGKGVGKTLIMDALSKAREAGKPLGLLCDKENLKARRLYDAAGFRKVGERPFAGHLMNHLQMK